MGTHVFKSEKEKQQIYNRLVDKLASEFLKVIMNLLTTEDHKYLKDNRYTFDMVKGFDETFPQYKFKSTAAVWINNRYDNIEQFVHIMRPHIKSKVQTEWLSGVMSHDDSYLRQFSSDIYNSLLNKFFNDTNVAKRQWIPMYWKVHKFDGDHENVTLRLRPGCVGITRSRHNEIFVTLNLFGYIVGYKGAK